MSKDDDRSPEEQPSEAESRGAEEAAAPEGGVPEEARDTLERIVDERVAAIYAESWPEVLRTVVQELAERIELDPEKVAVMAADIGQARLERSAEIIKRRLHRDVAAGGGSDGRASDGGGGGDDDGADDVRALGDLPDEPRRAEPSAAPRPVSSGDRRDAMAAGVVMGLSRIFEDPAAFLTAGVDAYVKLKQAGATTPDDLALAEGLFQRKPWLFDVFAKADPLSERIPAMGARAFDAGLKVGSSTLGQVLRDFAKGRGQGTAARFNPYKDLPPPDDSPPERVPEPATAAAAQDPQPTRGRLRKVA